MSLLSTPLVADTVARIMRTCINPTPKTRVRFPEIPGNTSSATIPTRHGPVRATLYHPSPSIGRPAVYVNVHGGGFVIGHREQDDPWCRYLSAHANVVVVNPDYVLAPTWRFPVQVEQIFDVLQWAASVENDWDGGRLCIGGQSAGGNLSAAASRLALEKRGPEIKLQVLHYAALNLVTATKDKVSALGRKAVLRPWMGSVFDTAYVPDPAQRRHPLVSPAWGTNGDNIKGIAPALVVTAEFDRLRDEGAAYARKLEAAGSLVEYREVRGADHGYNIMSDAADVTRQMYDFIASHVRHATSAQRHSASHPR